jgi:hypothetical protein
VDKSKRSLGRDVFGEKTEADKSKVLKKLLQGSGRKEGAGAREVEVRVKLTPSNIKHLDTLRAELETAGKGRFTRNDLIRIAITLLTAGDF